MEKSTNFRRNFYKWHRILGLTALVPVICWTLSGVSHPFMSNWFRPFIPVETYQQPSQKELKPALTLSQVLTINKIDSLRNFSLVDLNNTTYYQVLKKDSTYSYYSAHDGKERQNADRDYAVYLARYFTQDSVSKIKSAVIQKSFDGQYQPINHLLPVWKISFDRADGMDIYVETGQNRLATFNNYTRKTLLWVFEQLHTWDFLADWFGDTFRLLFMTCIVGVLFLSMLSGIIVYGFLWKRFKEIAQKRKALNGEDQRWIHRYHRKLGLAVSFLMLLFFTSAGFHLLVKINNTKQPQSQFTQIVSRNSLIQDNNHLPIADSLLTKIGLVNTGDEIYYQITDSKKNIRYFSAKDGKENPYIDEYMAMQLVSFYHRQISEHSNKLAVTGNKQVRQFTNEYGFINKRLPVREVILRGSDNWYVETTTGKLAAHVAGIDRAEGLSFIFMHKFFWMTWAGKDIRDIVSMLAALSILLVSIFGFAAFIKTK